MCPKYGVGIRRIGEDGEGVFSTETEISSIAVYEDLANASPFTSVLIPHFIPKANMGRCTSDI